MVKCIVDEAGFSEYWTDQNSLNPNFVKLSLKQRMHDQFTQRWLSDIENSTKGNLYPCIKPEFRLQPYLLKLIAINRVSICKLRTCNLKLPIETGRWRNIPLDERYCTLCEDQLIGNEFHYLFICKKTTLVQMRSKYIPTYTSLMYPLIMKCTVYCSIVIIFHLWIDYLFMLEKHHHCFETCL